MSLKSGYVLGFGSCVLLAAVGYSQQQAAAGGAVQDGRIHLDVVVTAKQGGPVAGLTQQDFVVTDNKVARPIASFRPVQGHEEPVEVILLVDTVNTRYETVAYERDEIDKFLTAEGGELPHPVTLAILTDKGVQVQEAGSQDGKALKAALDSNGTGLRTVRRSAGFYGAEERLDISLHALDQLITREETRPGRKVMIWVSPGWPLLSGPGVQLDKKQQEQIFNQVTSLSTRLRKGQITLYSVNPLGTGESLIRADYYKAFVNGVSKPSQVDPGDLGLEVLATQSGGLALATNNDITGMLQRVMNETKVYYDLSFEAAPGDHANDYHRILVQVDKAGLVARTRSGYYAQP